jgi:condensin complex subunit 2
MSKNFDEGGARGMLLNQLSVQEGCRLAFDSVDVADVDGQVHVGASGAAPDTAERVDCREFSSKLAAVLEHRLCPQLGLLYDKLEANGIDTAATANWQDVSMVGPASPVCAPCSVAPRTSNASAATTGVAPRAVHFDDSVAAPAGEASLLMPVDVDDITLGGELGDGNASDDNDVGGEGMNYSAMSAPSLNAEEQAEIDDAKQLLEGNGLPFVDAALLREFLRPAVKQVVKEKKARERKTKAALAAAEKAKAKAKAKGKGRGKDADGAAAPRARKEKTVFTVDFSAPSPDDDAFAAPRAAKSTQLSDAAVRRAALADDAFLLPSDAVVDDSDVDVDASTMTAGATGGIRRGSGGSGGHEMGDGDSDDGGGGAFGGYDSDGPVAAVDSSTWADTTTWVKPPPGVDLSEIHYSRVAKTVR